MRSAWSISVKFKGKPALSCALTDARKVVVVVVEQACSGTKCSDAIWAQITHTQDKADLSDSDKA